MFLLQEGIIEVESINLFATAFKILIWLIGWVKIVWLFKFLSIEPNVSCIEHFAHIALQKNHYSSIAMICVEQCDGYLQMIWHLDNSRGL